MQLRGGVAVVVAFTLLGVLVLTRAIAASATARQTQGRVVESANGAMDTTRLRIASPLPTRASMRNVIFHVADDVSMRIHTLEGELRSPGQGFVDLDDPRSYQTVIDTAVVGLTGEDISNLLNKHVFAYRGAPLRKLKVEIRGGDLHQSGTLHKGVDIPFSMVASVSLTADQQIKLHPKSIRIFGVNGAKLMSALGLNLQKMLDLSRAKGVSVKGNDLFLSPLVILPPPAIAGHIVELRIANGELVQVFGPLDSLAARRPVPSLPDSAAQNYMFYRGGTLHFSKLYMTDAELLIVDGDPSDAFDFDNERYQRQLVAGRSRTLPDLGLEVWMPDAGKVPALPLAASHR